MRGHVQSLFCSTFEFLSSFDQLTKTTGAFASKGWGIGLDDNRLVTHLYCIHICISVYIFLFLYLINSCREDTCHMNPKHTLCACVVCLWLWLCLWIMSCMPIKHYCQRRGDASERTIDIHKGHQLSCPCTPSPMLSAAILKPLTGYSKTMIQYKR